MSEMVERVARAIFETWAKATGSASSWEELLRMVGSEGYPTAKEIHALAIAEALAAIAAMREPTEAMIEAGVTADTGKTLGDRVANCHRAMIDAATRP